TWAAPRWAPRCRRRWHNWSGSARRSCPYSRRRPKLLRWRTSGQCLAPQGPEHLGAAYMPLSHHPPVVSRQRDGWRRPLLAVVVPVVGAQEVGKVLRQPSRPPRGETTYAAPEKGTLAPAASVCSCLARCWQRLHPGVQRPSRSLHPHSERGHPWNLALASHHAVPWRRPSTLPRWRTRAKRWALASSPSATTSSCRHMSSPR